MSLYTSAQQDAEASAAAAHAGLGFSAPLVIDPRLHAPRGEQFTNAYQQAVQRRQGLDDDDDNPWAQPGLGGDWDDGNDESRRTADTPIESSNIGFKLLQKMGWKGKGLGKDETGIVEPVKAGVEAGVRLGLGKQEEDDAHTNEATAARKRLEIEVAAQEDEEASKRREAVAETLQKRAEDVKEMLQTFYCEVCDKQYTTARQLEEHLSSYDHHHRKRLAETKAAMAERNREDRQRREQRAAEKEMARLQKQVEAAQQRSRQQGQAAGAQAATAAAAAAPPLPDEPPPLPPPLPGDAPPLPPGPPPDGRPGTAAAGAGGVVLGAGGTGISFGLGAGAGAGRGRGGVVRGGMAMGGLKRPAGAPMGAAGRGTKGPATGSGPGRPAAVAGFGLDSDDEEGN